MYSLRFFFTIFLLVLFLPLSCYSANIYLDPVASKAHDQYLLKVDRIDKLAGLKVTIKYDSKKNTFESAGKTSATSSFLHVINGKTEGKIIVVMASARGVSGDEIGLISLTFSLAGSKSNTNEKTVSVLNCQLMDEELKEIPCSFVAD